MFLFRKIYKIFSFLLIFIILVGVIFIPFSTNAVTLLQDDFTGTSIDLNKWNLVGGTEGVDFIQNGNVRVSNSSTNGSKSLNSDLSFTNSDDLTISANISGVSASNWAYFGYGDYNFLGGTSNAYYIFIHNTNPITFFTKKNGTNGSSTLCGTYTSGAKMSLKMKATSVEVYKNDVLACTRNFTGVDPAITNKPIFLQGSGAAGVFYDNILVENSAVAQPDTEPDAITDLDASEWGNTTTTLTWSTPGDGGDPITDYTVDYRVSGDIPWINFNDGVSTSTSVLVTGLTNGVTYEFRVRAINGIGTAPDSNIASVTVLAPTAPSTPTAPTASLIFYPQGGRVSVAFSAPSANGSPITSYTVTSSPGGIQANGASSPIVVTGLTNNQAYTFTVTATNGIGTSASSPASNQVTPVAWPDGLATWSEKTNSAQRDWRDIATSSDGGEVAAISNSDYVYTSTNGGDNWSQRTNSGVRVWKAITSSSDGLYLAGIVTGGYIYTSSDGGANWTERTSPGQRQWTDITSSLDGQYVFAVASDHSLYRSVDYGVNWSSVLTQPLDWNTVASSADGSKVYIAPADGASSYIYYSTDYGQTFGSNFNSQSRLWSSIATSQDGVNIVASVNNGYIYTSSDSGLNWTERTGSGSRIWVGVSSSGDFGVLAAASPSGIFTSVDNGVTWVQDTNSADWRSVDVSNDGSTVYALIASGYIYRGDIDTTAPTLAEVTPVSTPTNDSTPNYTFSSNEAGDIIYGGSCTSATTSATVGNNTITFTTLTDGTYSNCTITVTDESGNESTELDITTFVVDTAAPTLAEVTPVSTPTNDSTPNYTFSSNEAGDIIYGGSCTSATTSATVGNNTITFTTLTDGTYSNCTITVTDESGNESTELDITTFVVDAVVVSNPAPTVAPGAVSVVFLQELSERLRNENNNSVIKDNEDKKCSIVPSLPRLMRLNLINPSVKILQQALNCKGYIISNSGAGSIGKETTFFGSKTREQVLKFQKDNNLTIDGIVGPQFRSFINK